jgi:hypothetical protein
VHKILGFVLLFDWHHESACQEIKDSSILFCTNLQHRSSVLQMSAINRFSIARRSIGRRSFVAALQVYLLSKQPAGHHTPRRRCAVGYAVERSRMKKESAADGKSNPVSLPESLKFQILCRMLKGKRLSVLMEQLDDEQCLALQSFVWKKRWNSAYAPKAAVSRRRNCSANSRQPKQGKAISFTVSFLRD